MPELVNEAVRSQTQGAPAARAPENRPRSRLRWVIILGLAVAGIGAALWLRAYFGSYESTDDAYVDGNIYSVSARVSGYVSEVNVVDNQIVQKGAVLVRIDPRDYEIAVERARAELADAEANARALNLTVPVTSVQTSTNVSSAQADLEAAEAAVAAAQKTAEAAEAQLQQAEANNAKAQADLARYSALVAKDEISRQAYDQAVAAAKASAAAVDAARASVAAAQQQVTQAKGGVAQAQSALKYSQTGPQQVAVSRARAQAAIASVQQKKAALDQAELNLRYCTIVAPVGGSVRKNIDAGTYVQPGRTLVSIVDLDHVWITANFKETQIGRMHPGQRATISVDAYDRDLSGHVESIAGASGSLFSVLPPENATGNYVKVVQRVPVRIALDPGQDREHRLRLGMSVEPKVWIE